MFEQGLQLGAIALLMVGCGVTGDNQPPVIEPLALTTEEDKALRLTLVATDGDGDNLELSVSSPGAGTLEIQRVLQVKQHDGSRLEAELLLVPNRDYNGNAGFVARISDGNVWEDVYIDIEVLPVNDRPIGANESLAASPNTPLEIFHSTLLANDLDGERTYDERDPLSITAVDAPLNGIVTLDANTITFVPASNFAGTARFDYTVSDGLATDVATVSVVVGAPNTAPVAKDDIVDTFGGTLVIDPPTLSENDVDEDGQALAVIAVGNATHGTVQTSGGVVMFTAEPNYWGPGAGFEYTVTDGVATDTGYVQVSISPGR